MNVPFFGVNVNDARLCDHYRDGRQHPWPDVLSEVALIDLATSAEYDFEAAYWLGVLHRQQQGPLDETTTSPEEG